MVMGLRMGLRMNRRANQTKDSPRCEARKHALLPFMSCYAL
jgi:hypothetical protein